MKKRVIDERIKDQLAQEERIESVRGDVSDWEPQVEEKIVRDCAYDGRGATGRENTSAGHAYAA